MSIDQIIDLLEKDEQLSGWQVRERHEHSFQSFHNSHGLEAVRQVEALSWDVEILLNHFGERQGSRRAFTGNARFQLDPSVLEDASEVLNRACFAALLVHNESYAMAEVPQMMKRVPLAGGSLDTDPAGQIQKQAVLLQEQIAAEKNVRFASAEFFADKNKNRYFNSQGVQAAWESQLYSGEFVLLAKKDDKEIEVFRNFNRRRMEDYDLASEAAAAASLGRKNLIASLPATGTYDVVFSGAALDHFFSWYCTQASAAAFYNKATRAEIGQALVAEGGSGTALNLWHDATLPYAVGSYMLDAQGVPAAKKLLVDQGVLKARWADNRYAQYLEQKATGGLGNVVVEAGCGEASDLFSVGQRPIYHLFDFSYFEPNDITGEFSAEIRAGEIIDKDGRRPVKGGSVSGSSCLALKDALFSKEIIRRERYQGPRYIRCAGLTLAGGGD